MARYRKSRRRFGGFRKRYRSSGGGGFKLGGMTPFLGAALYGAFRERISTALQPITGKLPFGEYADEVGMFITLWAAKRFIGNKVPMVRDVANAGMLIEAARVGSGLASGMGATSSNSGLVPTLGV
jgi:hypothetical protein